MPAYTIQQGDHLSALAERFGFFELKSIWDHPKNAALKAKRSLIGLVRYEELIAWKQNVRHPFLPPKFIPSK